MADTTDAIWTSGSIGSWMVEMRSLTRTRACTVASKGYAIIVGGDRSIGPEFQLTHRRVREYSTIVQRRQGVDLTCIAYITFPPPQTQQQCHSSIPPSKGNPPKTPL